ncbi:hypothetical protein [Nocardia sp. CA-290969]|uniref:hypothetical protein n=1 Tax=Nocardia sp. CA-290969 TaxID=3239986 RepID=UPI003D936269
MDPEVIPPAERRDTVRRLLALCHIVNELVDLAESDDTDSTALHQQALLARTVLHETVVDLVAAGRAGHSDAA